MKPLMNFMRVVTQAKDLEIGEPKLPRCRKPLKRVGGSDPHQFDEPKRSKILL